MIRTLETNTAQLDADLRDEIRAEKTDVPYVKQSSERLMAGEYSKLNVGDYAQKVEERTARAQAQRRQYEVRCLAMLQKCSRVRACHGACGHSVSQACDSAAAAACAA